MRLPNRRAGGRVMPEACFQHDDARRPSGLIPRRHLATPAPGAVRPCSHNSDLTFSATAAGVMPNCS